MRNWWFIEDDMNLIWLFICSRCSTKTIAVVVLDENEYAPKFQAPTQRVVMSEDMPSGTIITTVRAYDGDNVNGRGFVQSKVNAYYTN